MNYLYFWLDIAAITGPVLLSFDKKVHYFRNWKNVFVATLIISVPFLLWDVIFTSLNIWGFNSDYLTGISIWNLPIEEVLFFFVVPFSCTFIYECLKYYLAQRETKIWDLTVYVLTCLYIAFLFIMNPLGIYTVSVSILGLLMLIWWGLNHQLKHIGLTFILSLLPFLIMNGVLTGSLIEEPIVLYDNTENSGCRIFTIPMEDLIYGMSLIFAVIFTYEKLNKLKRG